MKPAHKRLSAAVAVAICAAVSCAAAPRAVNLRCRSMVNPVGIENPTFSWQLSDGSRGAAQTGYEIQVATSREALTHGNADVWQSGRVKSSEQLHIKPGTAAMRDATRYWWRVRLATAAGKTTPWSTPATFVTALNDWGGSQWIAPDWSACKRAPYLRHNFTVREKPAQALVYICTLGTGELWLNGNRVDETRVFDPAQTNYDKYALYSTYDITPLLKAGSNCIGAVLANGWYNQDKVWGGLGIYGKPKMRLKAIITYPGGETETFGTDNTWQWAESPIVKNNVYQGEEYDANLEIPDWSLPQESEGWRNAATATDGVVPPQLRPQMMEPMRTATIVKPVASWRAGNGRWVIDMGANITALPRITGSMPAGTKLTLRCGEELYPDSTIDFSTTGVVFTDTQSVAYTFKGTGVETWHPRFSYQAFRYIEVEGAAANPARMIDALTMHSAVEQIGSFWCDNGQINRLHEIAVRTMLNNIQGIPTDCPHRERCGWLGDAHAVAPYEMMNYGMENFFLKYNYDILSTADYSSDRELFHHLYNSQFYYRPKEAGLCNMIAPGRRGCGVASPDWGTAQVQIPWDLYWYYGNKEAMEQSYHFMQVWVNHIEDMSAGHIVPHGLGDWCPPVVEGSTTCPVKFSSTAYHYYDLTLMEKMAGLLEKADDAARYAALRQSVQKALVDTFYNQQMHTFGSLTADAMALDYGIAPAADRAAIAASMVRTSRETCHGFMNCGIFGLGHIGNALSQNGQAKAAVGIFTKTGDNSFGYMFSDANATTTWEILPINAASKKKGLTSSLDHPMQSVYDRWFYECIGGIAPAEAAYKRVRFEIVDGTAIHSARASVNTPYGLASSSWSTKGGTVKWKVTVPANAAGELVVPAGKTATIKGICAGATGTVALPAGSYVATIK